MKIPVPQRVVLFELLQERFPDSSTTALRKLLRHGRVFIDGRPVERGDSPVEEGQLVEVVSGRGAAARPPGRILFRDAWLLAVEKPSGILSVGRGRPGEETFYQRLQAYVRRSSGGRERIFVVHRLDREVSGVLLFALAPQIQEQLQRGWDRTEKVYWALVEGRPPEEAGTIRSRLRETRSHRVYSVPDLPTRTRRDDETGELGTAITHYRVRKFGATHSVLEVRIETGRKNQIRVHLSDLGCPVAGDRRYRAQTDPIRRLGLHASVLGFTHPVTGERIRLTSRPPHPRLRTRPARKKK